MRIHKTRWATVCIMIAHAVAAHAGSIIYSPTTTPPATGGADISNLTGAATDAENVSGGNDSSTYVSFDRPAQGQTFTTGSNLGGYTLSAITLQQVAYTSFVSTNGGSTTLTVRLSTVTGGTVLLPFLTDTATADTADPNRFGNFVNPPTTGSGRFLTFTFTTPVILAANTLYGFDMDVTGGAQYFFETNGTNTNPYAGGQAYTSGSSDPSAGGNTVLTPETGDRVFIASIQAVPEPSTLGLSLLSGMGLLGLRRRRA